MERDCIFAADVHLGPDGSGDRMSTFLAFLDRCVQGVPKLYLLGDIFDYWVGKAMLKDPALMPFFDALRDLSASGTSVMFFPGNRDFLFGPAEAARFDALHSGGESLTLDLGGKRAYLIHGDNFCLQDKGYMRMRKVMRGPFIRWLNTNLPEWASRRIALTIRSVSTKTVKRKPVHVTDIDESAVQPLIENGIEVVICGHVHRPQDRILPGGGRLITLSEWGAEGGTYAWYGSGTLELARFTP